ncbi:MAG TPA: DNA gyrase subunit A [Anaerolineaceae bacterium]
MEIGSIQSVDIDKQMRTAYLDYAMSVIVARALPDARDGLKPVHRRILYAMYDMGIRANSGYKKSARIVGEVLGKYHPHGDMSVYDAMARLAQNFSMRYMLVDGQGNFGSVDGDPPAAMRYTEARLSAMSEEMLGDIDRNTVDFVDNFDGSLQEPVVLPSRLPNLFLNGSSGIAVGMATSIPPHNLRELSAAISHLIDHYDTIDDVTNDELMQFVPGPDFPTGGIIIGREGIRQGYNTGRSRLTVRGMAQIEEIKAGRNAIIITEIPYQVNKSSMIERIAELVREGRIEDISDLRDESDRNGMSIVIELKRNAHPRKVLNQLYKYTALQSTFSVQMLALVDGETRTLSLKRALHIYIEHRLEVITRRTQFDLDKARARAHILTGLLIALSNLDAVIQTIRQSPDVETARIRLVTLFKLSELQAQAILEMQLRRLAALERQKIEDEQRETLARIAYMEDLLASPAKILALIKTDLSELAEKYGDERRTRITFEEKEELREEDLVRDEPILISFSERGYIKRMAVNVFKSMNRGRRGVSGQTMREEDEIVMLIPARSLQTILFFSDRGKVYSEKAFQIPDAGRTDKGIPIVNVLSLDAGEKITAAVAVPDFNNAAFCIMATVKGRIKRVALKEFASVRPSGMIAIGLDGGDYLSWARLTSGKDDVMLITAQGQALRIHESAIRPQGRPGSGVIGIRLDTGDRVASMDVVEPGGFLMVLTEQGYGKRIKLEDYTVKGRSGSGVTTVDQKSMEHTGKVAVARIVQVDDEITVISAAGTVLRLKAKDISVLSRSARGLHVMNMAKGDLLASLARFAAADLDKFIAEDDETKKN